MSIPFWIASATLLLTTLAALDLFTGNRSVGVLCEIPPDPSPRPPRISSIVAARNEQHTIRAALQSPLDPDYPLTSTLFVCILLRTKLLKPPAGGYPLALHVRPDSITVKKSFD